MPKYKGLIISDIHVGAGNLEKLHNEYLELFIKKIHDMKKLDFLIIAGDFFHHKFYLNDKEATIAYIMLKELVLACKEKDTVIRIVYGTESHECNQYDILSLLKIYDKIEVVKYAKEEELLDGLDILYLPEEHLLDKDEYYKKYFKNIHKYDYVFGHGIIREVMKEISVHLDNKPNENKRKKVPVFTSLELSKICKGQVFFGHYHINQELDDKIISISSFSRWQFGEEERKGFYEVSCNTEKETYDYKFIENTLADSYKTVSFGYNNKMFADDIHLSDALDSVDASISRDLHNHVRFIFNIPTDTENPEATMNYLKERYKNNNNLKLEIVHGYIEEKRKQQKEQVDRDSEKYNFIFDENLSIEDKLNRFISIEYHKEIPVERINMYIYNPLNEIINA